MNRLRSKQVVPAGGWVYVESGIRLEAFSFDALVDTLTRHRVSNAIELGDPGGDIEHQLCLRQPDLCVYDWSKAAHDVGPIFSKLLRGQIPLVDRIEASRRALICCGCPQNVKSSEARVPCRSCGGRLKDQLFNKLADVSLTALKAKVLPPGKPVEQYENIHTCKVCGCDIELTVWLPKDEIQIKDKTRYPAFCWKI